MIISREFITKVSEAISHVRFYIPGQAHPKIVDACLSELQKLGYLSPLRDVEADGFQWSSWVQDEPLYFDFIAYNDKKLILGECRFYRDGTVPVEAVEDYISRITKVKPEGRKISGLFISNLPLCKDGVSIIHSIEDVQIETLFRATKK
ncbi:MAG: hypothetical protein ACTSQE_02585 [Candidatus Heimdallarchaeaceae archaeon]